MRRRTALVTLALAALATRSQAQSASQQPTGVAQTVIAQERALWAMMKKNDYKGFDDAVNGMMYAGSSGVVAEWKAGDAATMFKGCVLKSYALDNMQARRRGNDIVVLSYKATVDGTCGNTRMPSPTYETAVWQKQTNKWVVLSGSSIPAAAK